LEAYFDESMDLTRSETGRESRLCSLLLGRRHVILAEPFGDVPRQL
jgi:hypothetical protein